MTSPAIDLPADQAARDRIRTDLTTNMLVEAGAGSGKTTSLVDRMLEHVLRGTSVERLTAVTFTRKAANELRERFQLRLERAVRESAPGSEAAERCARALRELDRAFLGTIHAFCARLLRERPLEVGLDPAFQEVSEDTWEELKQGFWRRWVERARREKDDGLAELRDVGVDPRFLYAGFKLVMTYPDVEFPLGASDKPDTTSCRRELDKLLSAARRAMPSEEPGAGWDALMSLVRRLESSRRRGKLDDLVGFCDALETISEAACKATQNRWSVTKEGKKQAKALGDEFLAMLNGPVADVLRCWREHRYPIVMRVLLRAAADFQHERYATGMLGFEDLLLLTAKLLRENPAIREELGVRYAYLLVDEFQDTDPIQAEVCFLLTSPSSEGDDWRTVTPRPGSLFVVGDPKQSIFRFRRADIQIYELVKRRMETLGVVLPLTANFRSVSSIEAIVNGHFVSRFPAVATPQQAAYRAMETRCEPRADDGVFTYVVRPQGRTQEELLDIDSSMLASLIAERTGPGRGNAGKFMILVHRRRDIAVYARALTERNVPVSTTGAALTQEHELRELLVVLRAIADPENAIRVVAALEGLFFGCSPRDLWNASQHGVRFAITHPPADLGDAVSGGLRQLHEWWQCSQGHAADVLLERILDDSGLLVHAVAQPLGDARGGALVHLVESLRAVSMLGATGLPDAMDRLEVVLSAESADASLRPGRTDAVRVMNLHKAKGLEAEVVMLAAPTDRNYFEPDVHIARSDTGGAIGGLCIGYKEGQVARVIAHPPKWAEQQAAEEEFAQAESARLLYVAATRAKRELWVAQSERQLKDGPKPDDSIWRPLAPVLAEYATPRTPRIIAAPGRRTLQRSAAEIVQEGLEAAARVKRARASSVRFVTVTEESKGTDAELAVSSPRFRAKGRGMAWGRAVHRSIEAMGRGRAGASLKAFVEAVANDEELDAAQAAALWPVVERVASSSQWQSVVADGVPAFELTIMRASDRDGVETIAEGVIDAVTGSEGGYRIVDWKTDVADDAAWATREVTYARQVETYAEMLATLTGTPVSGRLERVVP